MAYLTEKIGHGGGCSGGRQTRAPKESARGWAEGTLAAESPPAKKTGKERKKAAKGPAKGSPSLRSARGRRGGEPAPTSTPQHGQGISSSSRCGQASYKERTTTLFCHTSQTISHVNFVPPLMYPVVTTGLDLAQLVHFALLLSVTHKRSVSYLEFAGLHGLSLIHI